LIDYFTNVGDVIKGTLNGIGYECNIQVMTEITLSRSHPSITVDTSPTNRFSCSPGNQKATWFRRQNSSGLGFSWKGDILSPSQLSILGSLFVSRAR
jgi:hypothetical protein